MLRNYQLDKGVFISKTENVTLILKLGIKNRKLVHTPMVTRCKLKGNETSKENQTMYKSMTENFYVTTSRSKNMQAICMVAKFLAAPKEAYVKVIKRLIYLKSNMNYELRYPRSKEFQFDNIHGCKLSWRC